MTYHPVVSSMPPTDMELHFRLCPGSEWVEWHATRATPSRECAGRLFGRQAVHGGKEQNLVLALEPKVHKNSIVSVAGI